MRFPGLSRADLQVKEFLQRFENIPNILELDHLTVSGDVIFGKDVTLKVYFVIYFSTFFPPPFFEKFPFMRTHLP